MSERIRGADIFLKIVVDGTPLDGSFTKVTKFMAKPRATITETGFVGEPVDDLDTQHHGWDLSWGIHNLDSKAVDFYDDLVAREENHTQPQNIQVHVQYNYRTPGIQNKYLVYYGVKAIQGDEGFNGRKDYIETSYEAKATRRLPMNV